MLKLFNSLTASLYSLNLDTGFVIKASCKSIVFLHTNKWPEDDDGGAKVKNAKIKFRPKRCYDSYSCDFKCG